MLAEACRIKKHVTGATGVILLVLNQMRSTTNGDEELKQNADANANA